MKTLHDYAREVSQAFIGATRDDGETFRKLRKGSPEWMVDLCREAHGGMMPDDFRYSMIEDAVDAISEADPDDDLGDVAFQMADDVDLYNARLSAWMASHVKRAAYVAQSVDEYGLPDPFDLFTLLQRGQYVERMEVFQEVRAFLEGMADEAEDEDEG